MKQVLRLAFLLACGVSGFAFAQTDSPSQTIKGEVFMVSLSGPTYPPLARQAMISGDVELRLEIRKDGSIQSAIVVRGHPMLTQAALDSARQSRFECRACENEVTVHSLIYSFQFVPGQPVASPGPQCPENGASRISQSGNRVTIIAEPAMVHPYFSSLQVRSAKCAYLWACSSRWGGEDYHYYRVRSAKCL